MRGATGAECGRGGAGRLKGQARELVRSGVRQGAVRRSKAGRHGAIRNVLGVGAYVYVCVRACLLSAYAGATRPCAGRGRLPYQEK